MKSLSETWFAEGRIDFELKKYTLLAYLQEINKNFNENKLYPQLADIIFHYNNIVAFRENKKYLQDHFPKKISGLQLEKLQLLYEQVIDDSELMQELEEGMLTVGAGLSPDERAGRAINRRAIGLHHDIAGLDISMHHVLLMRIG